MLAGISWREAAKLEDPVKTGSSNWDLGLLFEPGMGCSCTGCALPPPLLSLLSVCLFISRERRYLKDNFPVVS